MMPRIRTQFLSAGAMAALLFCAAIVRGQQSTDATQPAQANRAITGRVVNSAGAPLPGGSVYAAPFAGSRPPRTTRVASDGTFKIDEFEAGPHRVWASVPGYVAVVPPTSLDAFSLYRAGDSVTLTMVKGGVITGTVTGSNGAVVGLGVFALRVRDENGKRLRLTGIFRERSTDDRGIYRMYGLPPGSYILRAARPRSGLITPSPYDTDVPTYFPSSSRDSAAEITVREGEEITADIQYRGDTGRSISGKVSGVPDIQQPYRASVTVALTDVRSGTEAAGVATSAYDNFTFSVSGVPDGDYELSAYQFLPGGESLRSRPQRVTVRGDDITNVMLTLAPLASIEGRFVFESDSKAACGKHRGNAAEETIVYARRHEPEKKKDATPAAPEVSLGAMYSLSFAIGDAKGAFTLRNLPPGPHRIDPRAPASGWYLRSIATPQTQSATSKSSLAVSEGITVKSGEKVSGVIITFTEGAAALRGQLTAAEGQRLPARTVVYLIPAEKENASNLLRYFETPTASDGTFALKSIPPGEYRIVARDAEADQPPGVGIRQDSGLRETVTREAEKAKQSVTLKTCERLENYEFAYPPITKP